jgi:hypothetical protein
MQDDEEQIQQAIEDEGKLAEVMEAFSLKMQEGYTTGDTPMHPPHGLLILAHKYYHDCWETMLDVAIEAVAAQGNVEVVDLPDEVHGQVHEAVTRRVFVSLFLLGAEAERTGVFKQLRTCDCGKVDDASLERFIDECTHDE